MRSGSGSADSIRLIILRFTALVHSISRVVYTFFAAFWKRLRDPRERVFISSPSSEIAKRVSQLRTSGVPSTPVNRDPEAEVLPLYSHSISSCRYLQEKRLLYFPLLSAPRPYSKVRPQRHHPQHLVRSLRRGELLRAPYFHRRPPSPPRARWTRPWR